MITLKVGFLLRLKKKTGIDEGKYGFYRVIRSQIFPVLMTLFGKMASLSYNNDKYINYELNNDNKASSSSS